MKIVLELNYIACSYTDIELPAWAADADGNADFDNLLEEYTP